MTDDDHYYFYYNDLEVSRLTVPCCPWRLNEDPTSDITFILTLDSRTELLIQYLEIGVETQLRLGCTWYFDPKYWTYFDPSVRKTITSLLRLQTAQHLPWELTELILTYLITL